MDKRARNNKAIATKLYLAFKIIYNYVDIITDMYLLIEVYNLYTEGRENSRTINIGLLVLL